MNLDSITLLRTISKVMNRIKLLAPGVLFVCLVISLLIILVGMKAQKRKIGYEIAGTEAKLTKLYIANKRLRNRKLKLQSLERIQEIALLHGMKYPNQQDLIKIKNE